MHPYREHGRRSLLEECSRVIRSLGFGGSAPESDGCPDRTPRSPAPSDTPAPGHAGCWRSEEHTSELQSLRHLVCRLLLEKKIISNLLRPGQGLLVPFGAELFWYRSR